MIDKKDNILSYIIFLSWQCVMLSEFVLQSAAYNGECLADLLF